ncbi:MAG: transposase [Gammaproteobacteria bacterium]|nr:transposase [Gammaproteobacteria bacterium]
MARLPRIVVPGQALHLVQRGNNRQACFFADDDYRHYLDSLRDAARQNGCHIHAYVLMTNHVHLLLTPDRIEAPSLTLQSVGRRYVRYINKVYRRTGTLWEGRYKSTLIDSERYLLTCSRYIELNPVRAGMVERPDAYQWSSFRCNADGLTDILVTPHHLYERLGTTTASRCAAYRALFSCHMDDGILDAIRGATKTGIVLGDERFRGQVERMLHRRVDRKPQGGDRKSEAFREREGIYEK